MAGTEFMANAATANAAPVSAAKETKSGKVGDTIVTVILILCVILAIVCSYTAYTTKVGSGVPSIFGYRPFSVQSDSMLPFFAKGDLVIDKAVKDPSELEIDDVITFWTVINGQKVLNTHRIVDIADYGSYLFFQTKGDNNATPDTTGVHQNDIVGVYKTHIKGLGSVLDFLQTGKGFFICIVVPMIIFFVFELISFIKVLMAYNAEKVRLQIQQEAAAQAAILAAAQGVAAPAPAPVAPEAAAAPASPVQQE